MRQSYANGAMSKLGWSVIMFNKIINRKRVSILGMVVSGLLAVLFVIIAGCDDEPDTGINSTIDEILSEQNAVSSILDTSADSTYYLTVWCNKTEVKQRESVRVTAWCLYGPGPTNGEPVIYAEVKCFFSALDGPGYCESDPKLTDESGWAMWNVFVDPVDFEPGYYHIGAMGKISTWGDLYCEEFIGLRVYPGDGVSDSDRRNALQEKEKGKIKKLPEKK